MMQQKTMPTGLPPEDAKSRAQAQALLNKLSPADKARVEAVLADESATRRLLESPQAQALLKKLTGGK